MKLSFVHWKNAFLPLLSAFMLWTSSVAADEKSLQHGVNRVNLGEKKSRQQTSILHEMANFGVTAARLTLAPPFAASLESVRQAQALGINVLMVVMTSSEPFYRSHKAALRTSHGRTWDVARLSMLDLVLFRQSIRDTLSALDDAKVTLAGIELGNEINWAHFNGDLVVHPKPNTPVAMSIDELSNREAFLAGLDKYIEALRIVREEAKASAYNKDIPIISAGLVPSAPIYAKQIGYEVVPAMEMIEALQQRGLDDLVDAYGIHVYPAQPTAEARRARIAEAFAICAPSPQGKPCWLTEWGLNNVQKTCPLDDTKRAETAKEIMALLGEYEAKGVLDAAYYFDWDASPVLSLKRCGGLSETGKRVLEK